MRSRLRSKIFAAFLFLRNSSLFSRASEPIQRVNADITASMLQELDQAAAEPNVSRQAVIKTFIRQALDRHQIAQEARRTR